VDPVIEAAAYDMRGFPATTIARRMAYQTVPACGRAIFTKRGQGEKILRDTLARRQTVAEARLKIKSLWM